VSFMAVSPLESIFALGSLILMSPLESLRALASMSSESSSELVPLENDGLNNGSGVVLIFPNVSASAKDVGSATARSLICCRVWISAVAFRLWIWRMEIAERSARASGLVSRDIVSGGGSGAGMKVCGGCEWVYVRWDCWGGFDAGGGGVARLAAPNTGVIGEYVGRTGVDDPECAGEWFFGDWAGDWAF